MRKPFALIIYSAQEPLLKTQAVSLIVPAEYGYLGILANHAPLVARLKPGKITLTNTQGKRVEMEIKMSGYVRFLRNKATLLLS